MEEQLETLKKWVQTGQLKTARGRSEDDLLTLIGQMEVALRQQHVGSAPQLVDCADCDYRHDKTERIEKKGKIWATYHCPKCGSESTCSVSFPKGIPKCCGIEMYPCGGVLGKRPDGKVGDVEHFWRCDVCKREVVDLLS